MHGLFYIVPLTLVQQVSSPHLFVFHLMIPELFTKLDLQFFSLLEFRAHYGISCDKDSILDWPSEFISKRDAFLLPQQLA